MKKHFPAFALAFIAVLFFLLGILRLNDLSLYTDSTRYLAWGNSIAHGNGFVDDTQPVPEYYVVNAPFYSAVLAPVLAMFPMSLAAAKVWTLLWGVLSIILFYFLMRRMTSAPTALLAAVFFAFNPLTLTLCTEVLSEAPFLCVLFSLLLLLENIFVNNTSPWQRTLLVILLGVTVLLREVGIAFVAAAILSLLFKRHWKIAFFSLFAVVVFFGLWTYRNLHLVGTPETSQSANVSVRLSTFRNIAGIIDLAGIGSTISYQYSVVQNRIRRYAVLSFPDDLHRSSVIALYCRRFIAASSSSVSLDSRCPSVGVRHRS